MKNNKRMIKMVAALCALVVLFVVYKAAESMNDAREHKAAAEEAAKTATTMIADFDYKNAVAVSYQKKGEERVDLVMQDSRWAYGADLTYPINQTTAAYMAYALASMGAQSVVNTAEADVDSFGLDDPAWTFSITYKDKKSGAETTHSYRYGNYNEFSGAYYFQEDGSDTVYMIFAGLTDFFEYDMHGLADAGTFPIITTDTFESATVTVGETTVTLSGDEIAASFVDMLNVLQPSDFLEYHVNDTTKVQYGLDHPWMTLSVKFKETVSVSDAEGANSTSTIEQTRSFDLQIGNDTDVNGETRNAYLADKNTFIYSMPQSLVNTIMTYVTSAAEE